MEYDLCDFFPDFFEDKDVAIDCETRFLKIGPQAFDCAGGFWSLWILCGRQFIHDALHVWKIKLMELFCDNCFCYSFWLEFADLFLWYLIPRVISW